MCILGKKEAIPTKYKGAFKHWSDIQVQPQLWDSLVGFPLSCCALHVIVNIVVFNKVSWSFFSISWSLICRILKVYSQVHDKLECTKIMRVCHGGMGHRVVLHKYGMGCNYVDIELEISRKYKMTSWCLNGMDSRVWLCPSWTRCFNLPNMYLLCLWDDAKTCDVNEEFATKSITMLGEV